MKKKLNIDLIRQIAAATQWGIDKNKNDETELDVAVKNRYYDAIWAFLLKRLIYMKKKNLD